MAGRSAAQRYHEHEVIGSCVCDLVACGTTLCNASAVALQICTSSLVRVISMLVEFTRTYSIDDAVAAYGYEWSYWWSLGGRECIERQDNIMGSVCYPSREYKDTRQPRCLPSSSLYQTLSVPLPQSIVTYTHHNEVRSRFRWSRRWCSRRRRVLCSSSCSQQLCYSFTYPCPRLQLLRRHLFSQCFAHSPSPSHRSQRKVLPRRRRTHQLLPSGTSCRCLSFGR